MPRPDRTRLGPAGWAGGHVSGPPALLTPKDPPGVLDPPGDAAHLWMADATVRPGAERFGPDVLDEQELHWADALSRQTDRECYVTAHVALRVLLGAYLGIAPARVRMLREPCPHCGGPHGRPAVAHPALHFSLSHSGDLALLAFAAAPVGVDVQTIGSADIAGEAEGLLHPREVAELGACDENSRADAFARAWVRKEAYLKGIGTGLGRSPSLDYLGTRAASVTSPRGWTVQDIVVPHGYAAALAVRVRPRAPQVPRELARREAPDAPDPEPPAGW